MNILRLCTSIMSRLRKRRRPASARSWQTWVLLAALGGALGCHRANLHQALRENLPSAQGFPIVLAAYQPWFGDHDHIEVGYSSHDPAVLERQVEQAQNLGIAAFVVDWYGQRHPFLDKTFDLLQESAAAKNFKVALMYDEPEDSSDSTAAAISALDYAYQKYIGPNAPHRAAYLTYQGRPMIFLWPRHKQTDWKSVRQHLQSWDVMPLLIMEDGAYRVSDYMDGYYAWVKPGDRGWSRDGSNWGKQYLENFYKTMQKDYPNKIAVGAAWPGFNDSQASWSANRYMDRRCGKTFEDSLRVFRRYYSNDDPLPFLMVVTWNDYEEGTAIERGINNCRSSAPAASNAGGAGNQ